MVVVVELGGLFIAEERWWGGLSASGGRRGSSQPLMAFGAALAARRDGTCRAVACSGEAARAARWPQDDGMGRARVVGVARSWWRLLRSPAGGAASSAARGARGRAQERPAAKAGTQVERVEAAGSGTSRRARWRAVWHGRARGRAGVRGVRGERVRARVWGRRRVPRAGSERRRVAAAARGRARSGSQGRACASRAALGSVREEREEGERRKGGGERKRKEKRKMEKGKRKEKEKERKRKRERERESDRAPAAIAAPVGHAQRSRARAERGPQRNGLGIGNRVAGQK